MNTVHTENWQQQLAHKIKRNKPILTKLKCKQRNRCHGIDEQKKYMTINSRPDIKVNNRLQPVIEINKHSNKED